MLSNSVSHYAQPHFILPSCRLSASLYSSRTAAHPSGKLIAQAEKCGLEDDKFPFQVHRTAHQTQLTVSCSTIH